MYGRLRNHVQFLLAESTARTSAPGGRSETRARAPQIAVSANTLGLAVQEATALSLLMARVAGLPQDGESVTRGRGLFDWLDWGSDAQSMMDGAEQTAEIKRRVMAGEVVPEVEAWLRDHQVDGYGSLEDVNADEEETLRELTRQRIVLAYMTANPDSPFRKDVVDTGKQIVADSYRAQATNLIGEGLDKLQNGVGTIVTEMHDAWEFISDLDYQYIWGKDEDTGASVILEVRPGEPASFPVGRFSVLVSAGLALKPYFVQGLTFVKEQLTRLPIPSSPQGFLSQVPANVNWFDTGIDLEAGRAVEIDARGEWSHGNEGDLGYSPFYGPDGWDKSSPVTSVPTARIGALIGRIANGAPFVIGSRLRFAAPAGGRLYLGLNDVPGLYLNNDGIIAVSIRVRGTTRAAEVRRELRLVRDSGGAGWRLQG